MKTKEEILIRLSELELKRTNLQKQSNTIKFKMDGLDKELTSTIAEIVALKWVLG